MKLLICLSTIILAISTNGELYLNDEGKVKITVFTDANNDQVYDLLANQVTPALEKFNETVDIQFIPWGRTRRVGSVLECDGGPRMCWANRVHRCGLDLIRDQEAKIRFMNCEFDRSNDNNAYHGAYGCARDIGINLVAIDNCAFGRPLDDLDRRAEEATQVFLRNIDSIPGIQFDDVIDPNLHRNGLERLESMLCFALAATPNSGVKACQI